MEVTPEAEWSWWLGGPPPNKPMNLTVPPQGHRSIIETPVRAAGPQVIGKALGGTTEMSSLLLALLLSVIPGAALLDVANDYGAAQLPASLPKAGWLGLCRVGQDYVVKDVEVRISRRKEVWDSPQEMTGRRTRVANCDQPRAIFTGVSVAKGVVKTARVQKRTVAMGDSVIALEAVQQENAPTKLFAIEGNRRMLLSEQEDGGPLEFRIRWAGDLDRDGLPDLLIEEDDEGTRLSLFLSTSGKHQTKWEPSAITFHGGC